MAQPNDVRLILHNIEPHAKLPNESSSMPVDTQDMRIVCRPSLPTSHAYHKNGQHVVDMYSVTTLPHAQPVGLCFEVYTLQMMKSAVPLHTISAFRQEEHASGAACIIEHDIDISSNYDTKRPILVARSVVDLRQFIQAQLGGLQNVALVCPTMTDTGVEMLLRISYELCAIDSNAGPTNVDAKGFGTVLHNLNSALCKNASMQSVQENMHKVAGALADAFQQHSAKSLQKQGYNKQQSEQLAAELQKMPLDMRQALGAVSTQDLMHMSIECKAQYQLEMAMQQVANGQTPCWRPSTDILSSVIHYLCEKRDQNSIFRDRGAVNVCRDLANTDADHRAALLAAAANKTVQRNTKYAFDTQVKFKKQTDYDTGRGTWKVGVEGPGENMNCSNINPEEVTAQIHALEAIHDKVHSFSTSIANHTQASDKHTIAMFLRNINSQILATGVNRGDCEDGSQDMLLIMHSLHCLSRIVAGADDTSVHPLLCKLFAKQHKVMFNNDANFEAHIAVLAALLGHGNTEKLHHTSLQPCAGLFLAGGAKASLQTCVAVPGADRGSTMQQLRPRDAEQEASAYGNLCGHCAYCHQQHLTQADFENDGRSLHYSTEHVINGVRVTVSSSYARTAEIYETTGDVKLREGSNGAQTAVSVQFSDYAKDMPTAEQTTFEMGRTTLSDPCYHASLWAVTLTSMYNKYNPHMLEADVGVSQGSEALAQQVLIPVVMRPWNICQSVAHIADSSEAEQKCFYKYRMDTKNAYSGRVGNALIPASQVQLGNIQPMRECIQQCVVTNVRLHPDDVERYIKPMIKQSADVQDDVYMQKQVLAFGQVYEHHPPQIVGITDAECHVTSTQHIEHVVGPSFEIDVVGCASLDFASNRCTSTWPVEVAARTEMVRNILKDLSQAPTGTQQYVAGMKNITPYGFTLIMSVMLPLPMTQETMNFV